MNAPLRQYAMLMRQKTPDGYMLAHLRPAEMKMLSDLTGSQEFVADVGVRQFASGGYAENPDRSGYSSDRDWLSAITNNYGNYYHNALNNGISEADWTSSPAFSSWLDSLTGAMGQVWDPMLLLENVTQQSGRLSDPLYGASARKIYDSALNRYNSIGANDPTWMQISGTPGVGQGYVFGPGASPQPPPTPTPAPTPTPTPTPPPAPTPTPTPSPTPSPGGNDTYRPWIPPEGQSTSQPFVRALTIPQREAPVFQMAQAGGTFQPRGMKEGGLAQYSRSVAAAGRGGDTELAFITPDQARILRQMGGSGTINPATGLPEYGLFSFIGDIFKGIGSVVKSIVKSPIGQIAIPIVLSMVAPGIGTAIGMSAGAAGSAAWAGVVTAVGMTAANKIAGASWGDALKGGAISGVLTGVGNWMMGKSAFGGAGAAAGNATGAAAGAPATAAGTAAMSGAAVPGAAAAAAPAVAGEIPEIVVNATRLPAAAAISPLTALGATAGAVASNAALKTDPSSSYENGPKEGQQPAPGQQTAQPGPQGPEAVDPNMDTWQTPGQTQAPKSMFEKGLDWATKPLMFKDATSPLGKLASYATSPLGLAGLAYMMSEKPNGLKAEYNNYLNQKKDQEDKMNQGYINALNTPPMIGTQLNPGGDPYKYGFNPESIFWKYDPQKPAGSAAGGMTGYAGGGLAQLQQFTGYTGSQPGAGGQDDVFNLSGPGPEGSQLAPGEFVFDATTVADAGDGSSDEGARKLEQLRQWIKQRKGRQHGGKIPPRAPDVGQMARMFH